MTIFTNLTLSGTTAVTPSQAARHLQSYHPGLSTTVSRRGSVNGELETAGRNPDSSPWQRRPQPPPNQPSMECNGLICDGGDFPSCFAIALNEKTNGGALHLALEFQLFRRSWQGTSRGRNTIWDARRHHMEPAKARCCFRWPATTPRRNKTARPVNGFSKERGWSEQNEGGRR